MAEKKYVIDNAELMAEWNWEKNNELSFDPKTLTLGSEKKYGGSAIKDTSGKREWQIEIIGKAARIVQDDMLLKVKTIYKQLIQL